MLSKREKWIGALVITIICVGLSLYLFIIPDYPLSKSQAQRLAAERFASYCLEKQGRLCRDYVLSTSQRSAGRWVVEYESVRHPKMYFAFIVHDDKRVEITMFQEEKME